MSDPERILAEFSILEKPRLEPRYNVAPSQRVWAVRILPPSTERELAPMTWGLSPPGDANSHRIVVMARAETIAERAPFATAFRSRRCLLLADGFYEWKRAGKRSFPYYIRRRDHGSLAMAALWQPRSPHEVGAEADACAIITRPARPPVRDVHHRMPALLARKHHGAWLDPTFSEPNALTRMLDDDDDAELVAVPVSGRVNSPAHDDAGCIEPGPEPSLPPRQFELWPTKGHP
jgi:putative SOS response-associated peptidase YedK